MMKCKNGQKKLGRYEFICLTLAHCSSLKKEIGIDIQMVQEPGDGSWCRSHRGIPLTGLLPMACLAHFVIESKTTSPGMEAPIIDWALLLQSLILKIPYSSILWKHFLTWRSFLSENSSFYQVERKLASTVPFYFLADIIPYTVFSTLVLICVWMLPYVCLPEHCVDVFSAITYTIRFFMDV